MKAGTAAGDGVRCRRAAIAPKPIAITSRPGPPRLRRTARAGSPTRPLARLSLDAREAFARPYLLDLVKALVGGCARGQLEPRKLAAREDMHVGGHGLRLVERPRPNEVRIRRSVVVAPHVGAASAAEKHFVRPAASALERKRSGRGADRLHEPFFDPDVDHERPAGNPLAIPAMTGVHDQGIVAEPVADVPAGASAGKIPGMSAHQVALLAEWFPVESSRRNRPATLQKQPRPSV